MSEGRLPSILIADDTAFMRNVLKDIIKKNGLAKEIFEAVDGIDTVKKFQELKPDLVTMDVTMPRADGVQALRAIMKLNPNAKVVMVSATGQQAIVEKAMKFGARDYITKPFEKGNVGVVLNRVLRQKPASWSELDKKFAGKK